MGAEAREREANVEEVVCGSVDMEVGRVEEWEKMEGVDARRRCSGGGAAGLSEKDCWVRTQGASGELLVSRGEGGGGIRFAFREVRSGEGVLGLKWCWVCSYVTGPVGVVKAYIFLKISSLSFLGVRNEMGFLRIEG